MVHYGLRVPPRARYAVKRNVCVRFPRKTKLVWTPGFFVDIHSIAYPPVFSMSIYCWGFLTGTAWDTAHTLCQRRLTLAHSCDMGFLPKGRLYLLIPIVSHPAEFVVVRHSRLAAGVRSGESSTICGATAPPRCRGSIQGRINKTMSFVT